MKARLQEVEELQADRERTRAALAAARDRLQVRRNPAHAHAMMQTGSGGSSDGPTLASGVQLFGRSLCSQDCRLHAVQ